MVFTNQKLSYFKNKTQLCNLFDIKLRDRFIDLVFAYHNPSAHLITPLTERTQSVRAPPNDCSVIQHCWTIMHSVEQGGQANETCLLQHLNSRVWDQNLPRILRKQTRAIFDLPKKWRETDQPPRRTISSLFLVSTVLLTPLSFLFLFEETSIVLKLSSLIEIQTLFVRYTGGSS